MSMSVIEPEETKNVYLNLFSLIHNRININFVCLYVRIDTQSELYLIYLFTLTAKLLPRLGSKKIYNKVINY